MSYGHDDYYQECFEIAMDESGAGELLKQMTDEQKKWVGGAIAGAVENEGLAFYRPENPMIGENERLQRRLKWQQELEHCEPCKGTGRLKYNAGPWGVNAHCDRCHGAGKRHPRNEPEPRS